ncbi:alcohol dehydrogenase catalytic domain-containing protein [Bradyrhizobium sp. U87765 SZCCT0131]|uniref:alcohol dehydrogenase n=1 Tax=unclassified Bradyrhizobium TaxID=2631580 RepID=UPI001BAA478B|nr:MULTISPECIES: alcohol dehydrogenase [unclassified Bradyrhizobium]MBR1222594.1 alcohol dehydrogenase catalytic domain-containing protein [Bradyrhizobium sp. U87765 SZCCT0131]MBR1265325.1 alcohol dehydrogenase catalytic domain-containing protein [Bradyrhizobium sp. U87765 SZCCT0134]MBR1302896.1 alcohol dehydrogenase catalytic domain-containing protein [Bradyrhizobium sp. U87765 SZCCT0110]MBR1323594.1 alcohol dehydrogenase catalytic domain-containing protein [Bradyrhizobium sp. U87765 SZCCT0109
MRAYAVKMFCEPIAEIDVPDPQPKGAEVVIEVTRCGVCHSDLHLQEGYYDLGGGKKLSLADRGVTPPVVLGHEVLGRLVAKGPDAPIGDDMIGRTFLVHPWLGCGACEICRRGEENLCPKPNSIGVHRAGGYAEKCLVPHPRYLVDVTGIDPTLAATYACSGLTAYSALRKVDIAGDRDWLLILGIGGVGLSGLEIAKGLGFRNIAVADIDPAKRELALASGAGVVVDPRDKDALATLQAKTGGVGAAIDFVGAQATAEFGIAAIRKAGTYVVVGLFGGDITLSLPLLVLRAINLRGSYVGNLGELKELIDLVKQGKVRAMPVEAVPMAQANAALDRLRAGKVRGRLVLERA